MTQKKQNAVPGSTAFEDCSAKQVNTSNNTANLPKVHRIVQIERLRHRFGMSQLRADLIARHAFNGGAAW